MAAVGGMRDGSLINLDAVYNFISSKYGGKVRDEIESRNKTVGEQVREFISKRHINFQNWKSFKDAYKDAYGIQISDLGMDSDELTKIQSYIKWRHDIIHDASLANFWANSSALICDTSFCSPGPVSNW